MNSHKNNENLGFNENEKKFEIFHSESEKEPDFSEKNFKKKEISETNKKKLQNLIKINNNTNSANSNFDNVDVLNCQIKEQAS